MTVTDSHSISSSGTFKPQNLVKFLLPYVFILFFKYLSSKAGKSFNAIFLGIKF